MRFPVKPELADSWMDLVADFTRATRAEPGNLWFEWSRSIDDPDEFVLLEAFRDDGAEAHVGSDHFQRAVEELPKALASTPRIINTNIEGDGWSPMGEMEIPGDPA